MHIFSNHMYKYTAVSAAGRIIDAGFLFAPSIAHAEDALKDHIEKVMHQDTRDLDRMNISLVDLVRVMGGDYTNSVTSILEELLNENMDIWLGKEIPHVGCVVPSQSEQSIDDLVLRQSTKEESGGDVNIIEQLLGALSTMTDCMKSIANKHRNSYKYHILALDPIDTIDCGIIFADSGEEAFNILKRAMDLQYRRNYEISIYHINDRNRYVSTYNAEVPNTEVLKRRVE